MSQVVAHESAAVVAWLQQRIGAAAHLHLNSRAIGSGDVFLAYIGARSDGRDYIEQAVAQGAAAIVFEDAGTDRTQELLAALQAQGVQVLAVRGLKHLLGAIASSWYGNPSQKMTVVAVTGTNGKTSCTQWLADILTANSKPCGVIGTLGIRMPQAGLPQDHEQTGLTTPDAVSLHRALAQMHAAGAVAVAIEASSIGIAEGRMDGLQVDIAVFTNLTRDHLDYHGDMSAYEAQKARLFAWSGLRAAVVNVDDPAGLRLAGSVLARTAGGAEPVSLRGFSLGDVPVEVPEGLALLRATDLHATSQGMVFTLAMGTSTVQIATPLLGAHNVANLLAVAGVLLELGWPAQRVAAALSSAQAAPGRLQAVALPGEVAGNGAPLVVVDYAHSPDALERALDALGPVALARGGRRICLFGCGGDRDAGKRPQMAQVAYAHAEAVVVTSDNPRSESAQDIVDQILAGLPTSAVVTVELDRGRAIRQTILAASPDDVILLAGKGHESYQEIAGVRHSFSDADEAAAVLAAYPKTAASSGLMSLADAAEAMRGVLHGAADPRELFTGVSTDSRAIASGELFIALSGEHFDGHAYVETAAAQGAVAAVVQRPVEGLALAQIVVPESRAALGMLAAAWRARFSIPVVGVTGSNGKTTTKEMIAAIFAAAYGQSESLATQGNFNNDIGVPLTLMRLRPEHRCAVIELGMNHPGEIAQLTQIAAPTVGLVNNAQREHQEFMQTVDAVARENGAVIAGLPQDGVAVFPGDDHYTDIWMEMAGTRPTLRFGLSGELDVMATEIRLDAFETRFLLHTPQGHAVIALAAAGMHNVRNALAAAASALAAGVDLNAIVLGLSMFAPVKGRMQRHRLSSGAMLIDDTYNANPDSARAAIEVLAGLPGPRVLVLGDMGEVGDQGPAMHGEVGAYARECGIDFLVTLGEATGMTSQAFAGPGLHAQAVEQIAPAVLAVKPASILVKGSRFMRMERVVAALLADTDPSDHSSTGTKHVA